MNNMHKDVVIVGAGISGIGAAYNLQKSCKTKSFTIIEGRSDLGGTWDLFKYPGVRSDSDMHTLGFRFKPWINDKSIADGPSILNYLNETTDEFNIREKILFNHKVKSANWISAESKWELEVHDDNNSINKFTCNFLFMCGGYYSYDKPHQPQFDGQESFNGKILHPQFWDESLDYANKNIVVIGSGATAVTLVPALAKTAKHVVMLQRSPSYVIAAPEADAINLKLKKFLPLKLAYFITRWKNILLTYVMFYFARSYPERVKTRLIDLVKDELGDKYDVEKHFTPRYKPWDQRMCLVPNGDLFESIKNKKASVVTDQIDHFTDKGIKLKSGDELGADLVVTATGLNMELLSNIELIVDEEKIDLSKTITYKGMMFSGVPNLVSTFGYTNASWTLGADLTSEYVCRLINLMEKKSLKKCCPEANDNIEQDENYLNLSSGYIERSKNIFPKQGKKKPWKNNQNFIKDVFQIRYGEIKDGDMKFS